MIESSLKLSRKNFVVESTQFFVMLWQMTQKHSSISWVKFQGEKCFGDLERPRVKSNRESLLRSMNRTSRNSNIWIDYLIFIRSRNKSTKTRILSAECFFLSSVFFYRNSWRRYENIFDLLLLLRCKCESECEGNAQREKAALHRRAKSFYDKTKQRRKSRNKIIITMKRD